MAETLDICAPADQTEGTRSQVLRWLKAVGDTVREHEPLIELETDKVTVEVPAPASGVLREILKAEQEEIAPGEVLGRLEPEGELRSPGVGDGRLAAAEPAEIAAAPGGAPASPSGGRSARASDRATSDASGAVASGVLSGRAADAPATGAGDAASGRASGAAKSTASRARAAAHAGAPTTNEPPRITPGTPPRPSPAVIRLLTERGLDASAIRGTGEGGRITVDDIAAYDASAAAEAKVGGPPRPRQSASRSNATPTSSDASSPASSPSTPAFPTSPSNAASSHSIPHSPIRKRIADHMVQSLLHTAPHVTTVFEADLSSVIAHRTLHKADFQQRGAPLTFTAYFLAATVKAIKAVPEANSRWTDTALEIYDDIHIGVATALEGTGLVVPVVRNVQSLDLFDIATRLNQLVTAARAGKLEPADVRGGTFTISNHGVSGSLLATPIVINQPQSAILGIGKLEKRPVVVEAGEEGKIAVRPRCYVTLTIDHRVMDGHQANHFLQTFVRTLEAWPRNA
jgi:2-oxoglutarate dehydrogenase E2 component (dihydrolipoamide succinyltransferase)